MHSSAIEVVVVALDSAAERERAARFRVQLRQLLAARCGVPPEALEVRIDERGKPRLAGGSLQFNASRSGALAAYAFTRAGAVGIDIEAIRPLEARCAIAERIFPACERRAYAELPEVERLAGFYRGWTRTEALAKALGGGLTLPRETLDAALERGWAVESFAPAPGFAGAVAYRDSQCR